MVFYNLEGYKNFHKTREQLGGVGCVDFLPQIDW